MSSLNECEAFVPIVRSAWRTVLLNSTKDIEIGPKGVRPKLNLAPNNVAQSFNDITL